MCLNIHQLIKECKKCLRMVSQHELLITNLQLGETLKVLDQKYLKPHLADPIKPKVCWNINKERILN